jgi:LAS superfamily LD-carboxypeptidase LdcB
MAEVIERGSNNGNVRIIDPNPTNENVNHEDLMIYVKLSARVKGRSILTEEDDQITSIENVISSTNTSGEVNYTYPDGVKNLTTDWTKIGGGTLKAGEDVGAFGIVGVDIDIKSSFTPQVVIDFVDVRGATLFEQGPCSQYASFFHMPYPVFELTVKGFYGKPVKYTLALRKFNTKFNPSTGNFEIKAEFVGYTYAFLADIVMGYTLASSYMEGGDEKLKAIWDEYLKKPQMTNKMVTEPVTIKDLLKDINELEQKVGDIAGSSDFGVASKLNNLKDDALRLKNQILKQFTDELIKYITNPPIDSEYQNGGKTKYLLKQTINPTTNSFYEPTNVKKLVKDFFGSDESDSDKSTYGVLLSEINNPNTLSDLKTFNITAPQMNSIKKTIKQNGLYGGSTQLLNKDGSDYYMIDIGKSFYEPIDRYLTELDVLIDIQKEYETTTINSTVVEDLGYMPTVRNAMMILLANTELFLQQIVDTSRKAETYHTQESFASLNGGNSGILGDGADNQKIYPWPEYYEKGNASKGGGSVLTYPGENPRLSAWPEVKFVEDFLKAYLELSRDLKTITGEVGDLNGFNNYIPMNPIESPLFDDTNNLGVTANGYYKQKQLTEVYKTIGERAFLVGDYTLTNGLTAWRSRYGYPTSTNFQTLSTVFNPKVQAFGRLVDTDLMRSYGYIDGVNFVKTIEGEKDIINTIKTMVEQSNGQSTFNGIIKTNIINNLKELSYKDWVTEYGLGISGTDIQNKLVNKTEYKDYFDDLNSGDIFVYNKGVEIKGAGGTYTLKADDLSNFVILDSNNTRNLVVDGTIDDSVNSKSNLYFYVKKRLTTDEEKTYFNHVDEDGKKRTIDLDDRKTSSFYLNSNTKTPFVTEKFKTTFLVMDGFDKDKSVYKGLGLTSISSYNFIKFGESYTYDGAKATLIQTPLWVDNLPNTVTYKKIDEDYKITSTTYKGKQSDLIKSKQVLAYLMLCTMGGFDTNYIGSATWNDTPKGNDRQILNSISNFFKSNASMVSMPKGFVLLTGAVLWRMAESGDLSGFSNNGDPLIQTSKYLTGEVGPFKSDGGLKKFKSYDWPNLTIKNRGSFKFIKNTQSAEYISVKEDMKTLFYLPKEIKQAFIDNFKKWANGSWSDKYLPAFDPINFGGGEIKKFYEYDGLLKGDHLFISTKNTVIGELHDELYNQFYTIGFTTPKSFLGIKTSDVPLVFNIRKKEFDAFIDGWISGFKSVAQTKLTSIYKGEEGSVDNSSKLINDPDIKLNLYRSFKSIYDKWISTSKGGEGTNMSLFYNRTSNNDNDTKSLLDHFQFVDRSFTDIGDKAVIDVTQLKTLADNPTSSLYQTIAELLSKNNFDFFPLPSFTNFGNKAIVKTTELEQMFEPVTDLDNVNGSPSFVCMYIGGTSTSLDMVKPKQAMCQGGEIKYNYEDDGTALKKDMTGINGAEDLENGNVTAFLVSYGIENQSHFKSISLDQAEFKETNESLLVIDQLAKGGNENNRISKGQNLYNIYQTRSYTCEVESLGNMMIQPMMYFQLENVPMFHGAYLITEVRHNVKPHNMTTTFSGVRVPRVTIPLVTDAYTIMVLPDSDISTNNGTRLSGSNSRTNYSANDTNIVNTIKKNGGLNGNIGSGKIFRKAIGNVSGINKLYSSVEKDKILFNAVDPLVEMLNDWVSWMKSDGFTPYDGSNYARINDAYRTIADQEATKKGRGKYAAPVGTSNHGWGIAIDLQYFTKNGVQISNYVNNKPNIKQGFDFNENESIVWLLDNSYKYGWVIPNKLRDGIGSGDEFWHWEYHGTAAVCHMRKYPNTYGHITKVNEPQKDSVTNPRLPDGTQDVYSDKDCGGDNTKTSDGTVDS